MKLQVCSIPRSGSTLVWQILKTVFSKSEVVKTHPNCFEDGYDFTVATIRHPYDVAASRYFCKISRDGKPEGSEEDMEVELEELKKNFDDFKSLGNKIDKVLVYEQFYSDYSPIYTFIGAELQRPVFPVFRSILNNLYSLEANKNRAFKLQNFNDVDSEGIHGDHIRSPIPGSWKLLSETMQKRVLEFCHPISKEWGYETD